MFSKRLTHFLSLETYLIGGSTDIIFYLRTRILPEATRIFLKVISQPAVITRLISGLEPFDHCFTKSKIPDTNILSLNFCIIFGTSVFYAKNDSGQKTTSKEVWSFRTVSGYKFYYVRWTADVNYSTQKLTSFR